jgi:hypothetical protein
MKNASYLTQGYDDVLAHQIGATYPGQAHFACGGPFGATCNDCAFFGYVRNFFNEAGDVIKVARRNRGCAKFHQLTGRHGPAVPAHAAACRYFERKEDSNG